MVQGEARERIDRIAELPLVRLDPPTGFFRGSSSALRELWGRRELVGLLSKREIRARYKDSSLGLVWSLMRPLAQLLIYYFAIGKVLGVAKNVPGFAFFVFIGLTGWMLYTEIVQKATVSIMDNAGLVKKVYLPREVFPLASVGSALFSAGVQFFILVAAMVIFGQTPHPGALWYALAGFVVLLILAIGLALLTSALNVYMRDVQHLVEVLFVVFFWASPIVYSYSYVSSYLEGSWLESVYLANPVTIAILGMQRGLWRAGQDSATAGVWPASLGMLLLGAGVFALVFLWISHHVFSRLQGNFAQEV